MQAVQQYSHGLPWPILETKKRQFLPNREPLSVKKLWLIIAALLRSLMQLLAKAGRRALIYLRDVPAEHNERMTGYDRYGSGYYIR